MSKLDDYCKKKNLREMDHDYLIMYRSALVILPLVILSIIFFLIFGNNLVSSGRECTFYRLTGLYCPGCGGTRAFNYFVHLHILKSLLYHPFVGYFMFSYFFFIINSFLFRHRKKCFEKLNPFILMYVGLGILFLSVIVKNILILFFGIKII